MKSIALFLCSFLWWNAHAQTALINSGFSWKYYDQGEMTNPNWMQPGFNDAAWPSGNAQLGYGEGDENTVVGYGPDDNNKYITTYFRTSFLLTNVQQFSHLDLGLLRDDGAVVYVNGVEVWRSNMPGGPIDFNTPAAGTVAWPFEEDWHSATVSAGYLVNGQNTIAVEVHQESGSSSDVSFDFSMIAQSGLTANITRGPYLQKVNQTSVLVRWHTNVPTDSRVDYGMSPVLLNMSAGSNQFTQDHEVMISGLNPSTQYYYGVGHFSTLEMTSTNMFFETMPPAGQPGQYQFLVLGDCGTGQQEQLQVKNAVVNQFGNHFDGVLLLGDNAYQSGFDGEYQTNFFGNKYNEIFENTVIWPAPGNHDYNNNIPFSPAPAYFDIFNCPTAGECGGLPSGTEKYYAFNYGNIHFISLDSYGVSRASNAPMATWLEADLVANTLPWIVVYWHHPPYTKGSHDSDNDNFLDGELVEMREEILPILEDYDVDLILNGHSHSYERSMLIDSHYGNSGSFSANHLKDGGSGDYPNACPYHKDLSGGNSHNGTVYCVMGNSGKTSGTQSDWPHPAMYSYTASEVGAILLDVDNNRKDMQFYTGANQLFDHFTLVKTNGLTHTVEACIEEEIELFPSWPVQGNSLWNPGNILAPGYSLTPLSDGTVIRTDQLGCIADTFEIIALQNDTCGYLNTSTLEMESSLMAYYANGVLHVSGDVFGKRIMVFDYTGRLLKAFTKEEYEQEINFSGFENAIYYIRDEEMTLNTRFIKHD